MGFYKSIYIVVHRNNIILGLQTLKPYDVKLKCNLPDATDFELKYSNSNSNTSFHSHESKLISVDTFLKELPSLMQHIHISEPDFLCWDDDEDIDLPKYCKSVALVEKGAGNTHQSLEISFTPWLQRIFSMTMSGSYMLLRIDFYVGKNQYFLPHEHLDLPLLKKVVEAISPIFGFMGNETIMSPQMFWDDFLYLTDQAFPNYNDSDVLGEVCHPEGTLSCRFPKTDLPATQMPPWHVLSTTYFIGGRLRRAIEKIFNVEKAGFYNLKIWDGGVLFISPPSVDKTPDVIMHRDEDQESEEGKQHNQAWNALNKVLQNISLAQILASA